MKPITALSLFNGISGLHLALDRAEIPINKVYYSEIDKFANQVTEHHYPNDIALGDVTKWEEWDINWSSIDLVSAGFPCQAWSVAGKQLGDKDERGMLFWTTLDIIKKVLDNNPNAKFLMENVKMKKEFEEYITYHTEQSLGYVEKILINSALVSAQNRNRYYWTNFKVSELPKDKGVVLKDIVEEPIDKDYNLSNEAISRFKLYDKKQGNCIGTTKRDGKIGQRDLCYGALGKMGCLTATMYKQAPQYVILNGKSIKDLDREVCADDIINESATKDGKSYTLTAHYSGAVAWNSIERKQRTMIPVSNSSDVKPNVYNGVLYRKLTPVECERLQNVPDNFTSMLSKTQRYKCLGNGWTIDVIAHILKYAFEK